VSILAPNCTDADALATAASVLGVTEGIQLAEQLPDVEALFVVAQGDQVVTRQTGASQYGPLRGRKRTRRDKRDERDEFNTGLSLATLGGGCFWCTQAVFSALRGVARVTCGYSGGTPVNPTYEQVCTGTTGHAEVVCVEFDPSVIPYDDLLQIFFQTHDPTTLIVRDTILAPSIARSCSFTTSNSNERRTRRSMR